MKKALVVVVLIVLAVWVLTWFRADDAVATSAAQPWPGGLGTLDEVLARYPEREANDACVRLTALVNALPKNDTIETFVTREISRGEMAIGEAPALPDVSAMRDLLLREQVIWERNHEGIGDQATSSARAVQMNAARALIAGALAKARANDAAAWDDLHAVWNLARSLEGQPQIMTQTATLSMLRMINAVAWKMPMPAPEWFAALQQRDYVPRLVEAFQYQATDYWRSGTEMFPTKWLAGSVEHDREIAEQVAANRACDAKFPPNELGTDLTAVWRRAFRYRAEREATANALRMREGKPVETRSACSDGTWTFDGTTLRFSRDIAPGANEKPMPLVLQLKS